MTDQIKMATAQKIDRLAYIDWMRGLACVVMFQAHCYDSWMSPQARQGALYGWSQFAATLPAPIFLFLCGVSFALVTERLREKGVERNAVARTTILRGAEVCGLGILFRVQEFVLGIHTAPWTDLLRVDVLNILGLAMMLMGALCWLTGGAHRSVSRQRGIALGFLSAAAVAIATPHLWTTYRPRFLYWAIESYIDGVHVFGQPQPWLFPLFPWAAFAFAGLAIGFLLFSDAAKGNSSGFFLLLGIAGASVALLSILFDHSPIYFSQNYDYWHTSPNFFLMRCGVLLLILSFSYAWCRWGLARRGFSPLIQLGKTSLLVYWVHIEFVYGGLSILSKRVNTALQATGGLLLITAGMLVLSILRTNWKSRRKSTALPRPSPEAAVPVEF